MVDCDGMASLDLEERHRRSSEEVHHKLIISAYKYLTNLREY